MYCQHPAAMDAAIAVFFVLLDIFATLAGATWWPAHPDTLAWILLGLQAAACFSLIARRRAPLTVMGILAAFTLLVTLLISPAGLLTPANAGNVWAPYATVLAAYGPVYYSSQNRRLALIALGIFAIIVCRPWELSLTIIGIGLLRIAVGPLAGAVLRRPQAAGAGADRTRRTGRTGTPPARRAGPRGGTCPAGRGDARRGDPPGEPDGAAGRRAADDSTRRARPGRQRRSCGPRAARHWTSCATWSASCGPAPDRGPGTVRGATSPGWLAESTAVGTPAELVEDGDPALASPVVGRTAYRIVREALTNVRKHAPGARVTVRVSYGQSQVRLSVRNTPADAAPSRSERLRCGGCRFRPGQHRFRAGPGQPAAAHRACARHAARGTHAGRRVLPRSHAARVRADRRIGGRDPWSG